MAALIVASILNPMNTSSLATALPDIARDLHASAAATGLLVAVVYVASAIAQPVMGGVATRFDARRVMQIGLALVLAAGVVGGLAQTTNHLLISRVLVGVGTSAAVPAAMVLLRQRAEDLGVGTPTRELASLSAAGNVMAAAGLPVGGLLVSLFGWRSVFFINAPAAAVALVFVWLWVPRSAAKVRGSAAVAPDWGGIALFAAAIVLTARAFDAETTSIGVIVAAVSVWAALVAWELLRGRGQRREPFIDVRLIAHSVQLRDIYLRSFLLSTAVYVSLYAIAQWLGVVHGLDAAFVGIVMLPQSLLSAVMAMVAGRSNAIRPLVIGSGVCLSVGAVLIALASTGLPTGLALLAAVVTTSVVGAAFGIGTVGNQSALYVVSTSEQFGVASGLLRTASYIGGFVAMALMGLVYSGGVTDVALLGVAAVFAVAGLATCGLSTPARVPQLMREPATRS